MPSPEQYTYPLTDAFTGVGVKEGKEVTVQALLSPPSVYLCVWRSNATETGARMYF